MNHQLYKTCGAATLALLLSLGSTHAITPYSQDFEGLVMADPGALSGDGWLVGANVFDPPGTTFLYNYFSFPAPNGGPAFSAIDVSANTGAGAPQGTQQLVVYSDYNNTDHGIGRQIESNVFREETISAPAQPLRRVGFLFEADQGNIVAPSTATGFVKVLDQVGATFAELAIDDIATEGITGFTQQTLQIDVLPSHAGQLLQYGFNNTATNFVGSAMDYDNLELRVIHTDRNADGFIGPRDDALFYQSLNNSDPSIDLSLDGVANLLDLDQYIVNMSPSGLPMNGQALHRDAADALLDGFVDGVANQALPPASRLNNAPLVSTQTPTLTSAADTGNVVQDVVVNLDGNTPSTADDLVLAAIEGRVELSQGSLQSDAGNSWQLLPSLLSILQPPDSGVLNVLSGTKVFNPGTLMIRGSSNLDASAANASSQLTGSDLEGETLWDFSMLNGSLSLVGGEAPLLRLNLTGDAMGTILLALHTFEGTAGGMTSTIFQGTITNGVVSFAMEVPEPSTYALLGAGLGVALLRRKRVKGTA